MTASQLVPVVPALSAMFNVSPLTEGRFIAFLASDVSLQLGFRVVSKNMALSKGRTFEGFFQFGKKLRRRQTKPRIHLHPRHG